MVTGDTRFGQAVSVWSRCVHEAGYPYNTPDAARAAMSAPGRPGLRDQEIRLAVTEATCAGRTGLSATARELDSHYGQVLRERYRTEVATQRRMELAAIPRARAIVDAG
jgi:hypothetical protein